MGRRQANARAASRAHRRERGLDDASVDSSIDSVVARARRLVGRRSSRAQSHPSSEETDRVRNHQHSSSSSSRMDNRASSPRSLSRYERDDQVALRNSQRALDEHRKRARHTRPHVPPSPTATDDAANHKRDVADLADELGPWQMQKAGLT